MKEHNTCLFLRLQLIMEVLGHCQRQQGCETLFHVITIRCSVEYHAPDVCHPGSKGQGQKSLISLESIPNMKAMPDRHSICLSSHWKGGQL